MVHVAILLMSVRTVWFIYAESRIVFFFRWQHFSTTFDFGLPIAFLVFVVPLQLFITSNQIIYAANTMMEHVAINRVRIFIVGFVCAERCLTLSDWYNASSTIDACLPIAHLLAIIPHELMWTLFGIVHAC
jgi:hypothetical protein